MALTSDRIADAVLARKRAALSGDWQGASEAEQAFEDALRDFAEAAFEAGERRNNFAARGTPRGGRPPGFERWFKAVMELED